MEGLEGPWTESAAGDRREVVGGARADVARAANAGVRGAPDEMDEEPVVQRHCLAAEADVEGIAGFGIDEEQPAVGLPRPGEGARIRPEEILPARPGRHAGQRAMEIEGAVAELRRPREAELHEAFRPGRRTAGKLAGQWIAPEEQVGAAEPDVGVRIEPDSAGQNGGEMDAAVLDQSQRLGARRRGRREIDLDDDDGLAGSAGGQQPIRDPARSKAGPCRRQPPFDEAPAERAPLKIAQ